MTDRPRAWRTVAVLAAVLLAGCHAAPAPHDAIRAYYDYDFGAARAMLVDDAAATDEQMLLNNLRLGLAGLAEGERTSAERGLERAFELLSTAGLNADRTTAAVLVHEGVRVWKGEPFEQALAYHWTAVLYALLGEWDNVRAAATNALFRLRDFGADRAEALGADDEGAPPYRAVDTNFALGFMMQALGAAAGGGGDVDDALDAALAIDPGLEPAAAMIRRGDLDTVLLVDYGKGPTKIATGPDGAVVRWIEQEPSPGMLRVRADGALLADAAPVADVNAMARDLRWNDLEGVRLAKSAVGDALVFGGTVVASRGAHRRNEDQLLAGIGMLLGGLLTKSGAQGDTRHLELAPQSIYLVPLRLGAVATLDVELPRTGARIVLPDVEPGTATRPRAIYVRLFDGPRPAWLASTERRAWGADAPRDVALPWILGGDDVRLPTPPVAAAARAAGAPVWAADLEEAYAAEGIVLGAPGPRRHVLDGGRGLYETLPYTTGHKRLMYRPHPDYRPRSTALRDLRRALDGAAPEPTDAIAQEDAR